MKLWQSLWTSPKGGFSINQRNVPTLTEIQWDISDLPLVQNNDYQY